MNHRRACISNRVVLLLIACATIVALLVLEGLDLAYDSSTSQQHPDVQSTPRVGTATTPTLTTTDIDLLLDDFLRAKCKCPHLAPSSSSSAPSSPPNPSSSQQRQQQRQQQRRLRFNVSLMPSSCANIDHFKLNSESFPPGVVTSKSAIAKTENVDFMRRYCEIAALELRVCDMCETFEACHQRLDLTQVLPPACRDSAFFTSLPRPSAAAGLDAPREDLRLCCVGQSTASRVQNFAFSQSGDPADEADGDGESKCPTYEQVKPMDSDNDARSLEEELAALDSNGVLWRPSQFYGNRDYIPRGVGQRLRNTAFPTRIYMHMCTVPTDWVLPTRRALLATADLMNDSDGSVRNKTTRRGGGGHNPHGYFNKNRHRLRSTPISDGGVVLDKRFGFFPVGFDMLHWPKYANQGAYFAPHDDGVLRSMLERSMFALVNCRYGFSSNRLVEVMATGVIPILVDHDACRERAPRPFGGPTTCLPLIPHHLLDEARTLPCLHSMMEPVKSAKYNSTVLKQKFAERWPDFTTPTQFRILRPGEVDWSRFNKKQYIDLADRFLAYTRKHLTARAMTLYHLKCLQLDWEFHQRTVRNAAAVTRAAAAAAVRGGGTDGAGRSPTSTPTTANDNVFFLTNRRKVRRVLVVCPNHQVNDVRAIVNGLIDLGIPVMLAETELNKHDNYFERERRWQRSSLTSSENLNEIMKRKDELRATRGQGQVQAAHYDRRCISRCFTASRSSFWSKILGRRSCEQLIRDREFDLVVYGLIHNPEEKFHVDSLENTGWELLRELRAAGYGKGSLLIVDGHDSSHMLKPFMAEMATVSVREWPRAGI